MRAPLAATGLRLRPMVTGDLAGVLKVEQRAYSFPWTRGNFIDSLAAGYLAELLEDAQGELAGYFVAMPGVDEMHLLNLTVAPEWQRQGHARRMLDELEARCRALRVPTLWLEVRASNDRARHVYRQRGFAEVGLRPRLLPRRAVRREDAVVMRLAVQPPRGGCTMD
jgi:ribosomal-protein-alanine N-acetyltransferase